MNNGCKLLGTLHADGVPMVECTFPPRTFYLACELFEQFGLQATNGQTDYSIIAKRDDMLAIVQALTVRVLS